MSIEGKSFKFKTRNKACFLKVTKVKNANKIFCDLVSIEKEKNTGALMFNVHSGLDNRLYIYNSTIYCTTTNRALTEVETGTFEKLYDQMKSLKEITKTLAKK